MVVKAMSVTCFLLSQKQTLTLQRRHHLRQPQSKKENDNRTRLRSSYYRRPDRESAPAAARESAFAAGRGSAAGGGGGGGRGRQNAWLLMRFCPATLERRILSWNLKPRTDSFFPSPKP